MNELKVSLKRIAEDGFTRNDEILADASKALAPQMGFELLSDINKNLLTIVAHVGFVTPAKEVAAALRFRFTLEVDSLSKLEHTTNPQKGTHQYKFPNGFIEPYPHGAKVGRYPPGKCLFALRRSKQLDSYNETIKSCLI